MEDDEDQASLPSSGEQDVTAAEEDATHQELIPPFLPNQKVFTAYIEQPRSPKGATTAAAQTTPKKKKLERYFEGVIRQVRHHPHLTGDSSWSFLIHFKGWNARYDRWITASELLPDTPDHRQRFEEQQQQEEHKRQAEKEAQKQEQLRKQQRKKELKAAQQQQQAPVAEIADGGLVLPFTLKTVMVEEWEKINRKGYDAPYGYDKDLLQTANDNSDSTTISQGPPRSVHALPATVTIRQLLKHFEKKTRKQWLEKQQQQQPPDETKTNQIKQEIRQFCKALGRLFENALPVCLLYEQERPQYTFHIERHQQENNNSAISPLDVYGCEFLLRLLVRLPQLMPSNNQNNAARSTALLQDLILLLQQNRPACFKQKFRPPIYPHEWLPWETKKYGKNQTQPRQQTKQDAKSKQKEGGTAEGDVFG
ncbi:Chromatin modification-related protein [Seminavis robusta]|uniref:Chromatin modification-related protein n=1 Tax=Seminavis robusta TaxID=568900 RepID=A0A9N8EVV5_9STRA|nr:Chromatin modification-related protein [Seminavis robusta]|eukprot:Sro1711_g292820.1 Chromatin modification-related protein (423) ;mRNA; r:8220-9488